MKKITCFAAMSGLIISIIVSNLCSTIKDGIALDKLRNSVLRLHILANSDDSYDQQLKLYVRDALLEQSDEIFGYADSFDEAEKNAENNIELIEEIATQVLLEKNCHSNVSAEITDMYFDVRTYGEITMPAGEYTALRVKIGEANGKNWWCVMYPPLCIPAVCDNSKKSESKEIKAENEDDKDEFFDDEQQDIIYNPKKYEVRFAIWDKIKSIIDKKNVED